MGSLSFWHWLLVLAVAMLLFGGSKVSGLMGDFGRGLRLFRREIGDGRLDRTIPLAERD